MQRYAALWLFPVVSLVLVVFMTVRSGDIVDAPEETPVLAPVDFAALQERNTNLVDSLTRSASARRELERHVAALHDELLEMRASRTALVAEATLWKDAYELLATRFDDLASLTRAAGPEAPAAGVQPASFTREGEAAVPQPVSAVIVR